MLLIAFLFGYVRLTYPEHLRTRLYRAIHTARIPIVSASSGDQDFSLLLTRGAYRKLSALSERFEPLRTEYGGVPYRLRTLLKHPGLILGALLGLSMLFFCRSRIWEIRIVGDGSIDEDCMRLTLESAGLWEGMPSSSLDSERIAAAYLREDGRVAWMQIRREGVVAYVEWIPTKEGDSGEIPLPKDAAANLVASEDAVIEEMTVLQGQPTVTRGEVVRAGDLLVSGMQSDGNTYACGEVLGRVRKTVNVFIPFRQTEAVSLGEEKCGVRITVLGFPISFDYGDGDGDAVYRSHLHLGSLRLPICVEREIRCLAETREYVIDESEAVRLASKKLSAELAVLLAEGELCSQKTFGKFTETGYMLTAEIEYLINIAKTLEFSVENE